MNRRQKIILTDFITVIAVTLIAVLAMINFKDWLNRSEAMRAMQHLSQIVLQYKENYGSVPPESYVVGIKEQLQGHVRLGDLKYRARWLDLDSTPDEILAYTEKNYRSLLAGKGFVVLRLGGRVEWLQSTEFKTLLAQQQNPEEVEMTRK
jgi:hypothetical protein